MSRDYKYEIQTRATDQAMRDYGTDLSGLSDQQQIEVYDKAATQWSEACMFEAEMLADRLY